MISKELKKFLEENGYTGSVMSSGKRFLVDEGFSGHWNEAWNKWLMGNGYTGNSLQERTADFTKQRSEGVSGVTARYWRFINVDAAYSSRLSLAAMGLTDSADTMFVPTTATPDTPYLWDEDPATIYYFGTTDSATITMDFGDDITPTDVRVQAVPQPADAVRAATNWTLQKSDDNVNWDDVITVDDSALAAFAASEERIYNIEALTVKPPVAAGALVDQSFTDNIGVQTYDVSGDFTGTDLTYSLPTTVAGVTINSSTGVVSFDTDALSVQSGTSIVARATNSAGSADSGFSLEITEGDNIAATFGSLTLEGAGATPAPSGVTSVTDAGGTNLVLSGSNLVPDTGGGVTSGTVTFDTGQTATITAAASTYSVASLTEFNSAKTASAGAARTIKFRNGDYSLADHFSGISRSVGQELTITGDSLSARMYNGSSSLASTANTIIDGLTFYTTEAYVTAQGGVTLLNTSCGDNVTIRNCVFGGETIDTATLTDKTSTYTGGYPVPSGVVVWCGENFTLENNQFNYIRIGCDLVLRDGLTVTGNAINYFYFDGFRLQAVDAGATTDVALFEDNTVYFAFGKYNEMTGGSSPHPDQVQAFNRGGQSNPTAGTLIQRRNVFIPGQGRNSNTQGLFLQADVRRHLVDTCLVLTGDDTVSSVHGVSIDGIADDYTDIKVLNSTVAAWKGSGSAEMRYSSVAGEIEVINSLFSGAFTEASAHVTDITDTVTTNSNFSVTYATVWDGPFSPSSAAAALSSFAPASGYEDKGAITAGGALKTGAYIPLNAVAPSLTAVAGGIDVDRAVPSDDGGSTITSYDLRYRTTGTYGAWTIVTGIAASSESISGLTGGTEYEVQTRAVNAVGNGFWSDSATATPTAVATVPDAFVDANWSVATGSGDKELDVTIASLPANGGAAITDVQYDVDASGSWTSLPTYAGTGTYTITMAASSTSYAIRLRAVNSVGNASAGNSESATSGSAGATVDLTLVGTHLENRGSNSGANITHTGISFGAADSNRHIIAAISIFGNSGSSLPTAVTIGGVSATLVTTADRGAGALPHVAVYRAAVPTGTTGTVDVTIGGTIFDSEVAIYRLIHSSGTPNASATDTGSGSSVDVSVATTAGGVMLAVGNAKDGGTWSWTGATEQAEQDIRGNDYVSNAIATGTSAETRTVTGSLSGSGDFAAVSVSWSA